MLFSKEELQSLINEDYDVSWFKVMESSFQRNPINGYVVYTIIFRYDKCFYKLKSSSIVIEMSDGDIECLEVKPVVRPTLTYEAIQ